MMTTLAELAARALRAMGDEGGATWSSAQVEAWLREGIADYSQYFPRQLAATITTEAGVRGYDLPAALTALLLVEYPAGKEPPFYLAWRPRTRRGFWRAAGYYDWEPVNDATAAPRLYLAERPLAGETVALTYLAPHATALASEDEVTVPVAHQPVLILYAVLMAWQERLAQEEQAPTSASTLLLSQYATNADRARRNYVQALSRARIAAAGRAGSVRWRMDKWEH
jgi:hypothetical protein